MPIKPTAWEIMLLVFNNLHENLITESQDRQNFGSLHYLLFALE